MASFTHPPSFDNLCCRRISGRRRQRDADADVAHGQIRQHFGVVGTTGSLAETMRVLAEHQGWSTDTIAGLARVGAPPNTVVFAEQRRSPAFDSVMARNVEDYRLFECISGASGVDITRDVQASPVPAAHCCDLPTSAGEESIAATDAAFAEARRTEDPELSFAQFSMRRVVAAFSAQKPHNSLGGVFKTGIGEHRDFWAAGRQRAKRWIERFSHRRR